MGGKGRKRREKNYLASHGGDKRLPPPPNPSSFVDPLPSKLRKIISFTNNNNSSLSGSENTQLKRKRDNDTSKDKPNLGAKTNGAKDERNKRSADDGKETMSSEANEEKKKKKRKRKQVNDLRFAAEMEKLAGVSTRRQRKKEYLKAKKKKHKKCSSEQMLDLPKRDEVKFGEVVEAPPNLAVIPKVPKKPMDASVERLRLQAIEAYRNRKGWTNRPGVRLPAMSATADL